MCYFGSDAASSHTTSAYNTSWRQHVTINSLETLSNLNLVTEFINIEQQKIEYYLIKIVLKYIVLLVIPDF